MPEEKPTQMLVTCEEILAQAKLLSLTDESRLVALLTADVRRRIEHQEQQERLSMLEFEGMDQES